MVKTSVRLLSISMLLGICACSTFNDKTGLDVPAPKNKTAGGALTGAAVGGGLGLIVGSTSGNAGEGLIVGSVAGGAIGAGIGNKLDRDDLKTEVEKDTAVREDLRRENQPVETFRNENTDTTKSFYEAPVHSPVLSPDQELTASAKRSVSPAPSLAPERTAGEKSSRARLSDDVTVLNRPSGIRKATPFRSGGAEAAAVTPVSLASIRKTPPAPLSAVSPKSAPAPVRADTSVETASPDADSFAVKPASVTAAGLPAAATVPSVEKSAAPIDAGAKAPVKDLASCKDAIKEAERGLHASSDADRLFYLRRAARLCPTEPSYHVELGKLYGTIGKNEDAKFELRQAIDLDPDNQIARDELSILENTGSLGQ